MKRLLVCAALGSLTAFGYDASTITPVDWAAQSGTYDRGFGTFRNTIVQQRALDVGRAKLCVTLGPSCWRDDGEIALDTAKDIQIVRDCGFDGWGLFEVDKIVESVLPVLAAGPTKP